MNVNVKTKNTFKYDYVPGFLLCLKNDNLQNRLKQLGVRTKLSVHVRMLETLTSPRRS